MRDLSFFLRLHSSAPLARFHRASLKPYLPLKVRYVLHPKGEIFLRINISERICWNQNRAIGRIDAPRDFVPVPLIEKLCRRGLACHYLASRYCNLSDFTFRGEEKREEEKTPHLQCRLECPSSLWGVLAIQHRNIPRGLLDTFPPNKLARRNIHDFYDHHTYIRWSGRPAQLQHVPVPGCVRRVQVLRDATGRHDAEFFATKPLQERFIDKIDGLPCTIKYENAHYIISMERDKQAFAE